MPEGVHKKTFQLGSTFPVDTPSMTLFPSQTGWSKYLSNSDCHVSRVDVICQQKPASTHLLGT
jgi:hypothetical protein